MSTLPDIGPRLRSGIVYTLLLAAAFAGGYFWPPFLIVCFGAAGLIMGGELGRAIRPDRNGRLIVRLGLLALLPPFLPASGGWPYALRALSHVGAAAAGLFCFALIVVMASLIRSGPQALCDSVLLAAGAVYLWFGLAPLAPLVLYVPHGWLWLGLAVAVPALTDLAAYFGGVLFGKRKIVPNLSPKKTVAGSLFGTIGALAGVVLFFLIRSAAGAHRPPLTALTVFALVLAAVLLSAAAQCGDWLASAIKRSAGIKDFGRLFEGHGGLMDRLDSFLFSLPFVFVLALVAETTWNGGILL